jgi:hypothetical protein
MSSAKKNHAGATIKSLEADSLWHPACVAEEMAVRSCQTRVAHA